MSCIQEKSFADKKLSSNLTWSTLKRNNLLLLKYGSFTEDFGKCGQIIFTEFHQKKLIDIVVHTMAPIIEQLVHNVPVPLIPIKPFLKICNIFSRINDDFIVSSPSLKTRENVAFFDIDERVQQYIRYALGVINRSNLDNGGVTDLEQNVDEDVVDAQLAQSNLDMYSADSVSSSFSRYRPNNSLEQEDNDEDNYEAEDSYEPDDVQDLEPEVVKPTFPQAMSSSDSKLKGERVIPRVTAQTLVHEEKANYQRALD